MQTLGALLDELDLEAEQDAGFDRLAELHAVDGHEIDQLAGAGEAQAFDREHARGLGQSLDMSTPGMIGRPGKWPWKKGSLIVTALIATISLVGIEALDAVDEQHRIAMRQRRHHPLDVERADGGACRLVLHDLAALRLLRAGAAGAVVAMLGRAALSPATTTLVTSTLVVVASVEPTSSMTLAPRFCITCW